MAARTRHKLSCWCLRRPLLAMYGLDERGRTYLHIKVYKQDRIYGEAVFYGGEVKIRCRECFRWQTIVFVAPNRDKAILQESAPPAEVDTNDIVSACSRSKVER